MPSTAFAHNESSFPLAATDKQAGWARQCAPSPWQSESGRQRPPERTVELPADALIFVPNTPVEVRSGSLVHALRSGGRGSAQDLADIDSLLVFLVLAVLFGLARLESNMSTPC